MKVVKKVLTDAYILEPSIFNDERGYFYESFNQKVFCSLIEKNINFVQDNQSLSSKGTLRGLHFQKSPNAQSKLVRVVQGSIYDVAVDLRVDSPTFKKSFAIEISAENKLQFFIPKGFAHGFLSLEDNSIISYKVDNYYSKNDDGGIKWNDFDLDLNWPKGEKTLSSKDLNLPNLSDLEIEAIYNQ